VKPQRCVLIADDEVAIQKALGRVMARLGHEVAMASDGVEAVTRLQAGGIDLCITDLLMPKLGGLDVVKAARVLDPPVPVVVLTGQGGIDDAVAALRAGAADFLSKPFHVATVEELVTTLLREGATPGRRRELPGAAVVGDHPAMRLVLDRVAQIADTDASVLIRGETGTGKEVIARLIHTSSGRRAGPFVAVNMAAVPEALAESELFGHEKGAFTGADRARTGRFAAAHDGTLFLDEIGDLPRAVQAKLLRALQERELVPLGGSDPVAVNVRVIAATHRDLEAMVRQGSFREDLFYRLDVIPIEVPPLRNRRDDIPALCEHFRHDVNLRERRRVPGFSPSVMQRLCSYGWPGNVRELENLIERLVVVAGDRAIDLPDLPPAFRTEVRELERDVLDLPSTGVDLRMLLSRLEDRLIGQALERTGGNKGRAAELLGLNRTTLVEKLRRRNVA